jgi:hypothetical protein
VSSNWVALVAAVGVVLNGALAQIVAYRLASAPRITAEVIETTTKAAGTGPDEPTEPLAAVRARP